MKRCILIFLSIISHYLFAQESIQGFVVDQADRTALENTSVVLLDADSIMQYFTRPDQSGNCKLEDIEQGVYLLRLTYPEYEIYSPSIEVKSDHSHLDTLKISSQANLLEEVVINQKIPIKSKGDTIEYDAGSFETEKNAKLEDL